MSNEEIAVIIDKDLEDLIPGFLQNRTKDLESLKEALTQESYEKIVSIGHNLKGLGGGYGFHGMSEIGAEIESAGKEKNSGLLGEAIARFDQYLSQVVITYQ